MKKNLITVSILLVLPTLVNAQSEQPTMELPPINVYSAYAVPVNQDKTASSLTVLTEKEFAQRNATYVSDILKTVQGVTFSASGGRGTLTNFYLRGADANHTAVIIDGVKVNPVTGYGFDFGSLRLSHIERIEVLRGEQSALWGSDAMGGVIYITTKSGLYTDKPFNLDFDLGTGSHGTYEGTATISGYHKGLYYALNGHSHRTKGISAYSADKFHYRAENGAAISVGGAQERDKFHRDSGSLRLGYDAHDKGIELLTSHSSQTVHYDSSLANETLFDDYTRTRETLFKLSGYVGSEQELFKHKASISHIKTDSDTFSAWASAYDAKKLNVNYQLDINFDRDGSVTQALSLLTEYQGSKYNSTFYQNEKSLSEKSFAAEYRLLTEHDHSLTISGRYINSSQYQNTFTGRLAGVYRLATNIQAHASLGSAVQNPTITEYYGWSGTFIGNPTLKPERSQGGDIGLLIESPDKHHRLDATYFARNVENLISSETTGTFPNTVSRAINLDGMTKIKGVELAYQGELSKTFSSYINYTYTHAQDSNKQQLVRRPKHSANLGIHYQFTEQLATNLNLSYVGKRVNQYYDEITWQSVRVKLPAYTLVNLGANYQLSQNLSLYAHLNNVFNKKYENLIGYGQDGRHVYVGLKGAF